MRILAVVVFAVLFAGCFGDKVSVLRVKKSDITLAIASTGELASSRTVELGAPAVQYKWQQKLSYLVPEGTWVKKGQKVLGFDAQELISRLRDFQNKLATERQRQESQDLNNEQEREQLKLDLAEAKMNLDKAEAKSKNIDNLMAQIEIKKLRLNREIAELNYVLAKERQANRLAQMEIDGDIVSSEVERLTAKVNEQLKAIESMEVTAPRNGMVVYRMNSQGEKPAEGDQFTAIQKIIEIPDLNNLIVDTTFPEQIAHEVKVDDRVEIKIDAIPEKTFTGKISALGKIVRVKSRQEPSKVFDALISFDQVDTALMRPGMATRLSVIQGVAKDAVAIPQVAIIYRGDRAYVRVKSVFGEKQKEVDIAQRQDGKAIIVGGLQDGEEVLL